MGYFAPLQAVRNVEKLPFKKRCLTKDIRFLAKFPAFSPGEALFGGHIPVNGRFFAAFLRPQELRAAFLPGVFDGLRRSIFPRRVFNGPAHNRWHANNPPAALMRPCPGRHFPKTSRPATQGPSYRNESRAAPAQVQPAVFATSFRQNATKIPVLSPHGGCKNRGDNDRFSPLLSFPCGTGDDEAKVRDNPIVSARPLRGSIISNSAAGSLPPLPCGAGQRIDRGTQNGLPGQNGRQVGPFRHFPEARAWFTKKMPVCSGRRKIAAFSSGRPALKKRENA